jgi:hypothetical protein
MSKWPGRVGSNRLARKQNVKRAGIGIAERGSVLPLTMVLVALSFASMVGLARLTVGGTDRSLAQQAADAAALAGARFDRSEAERLAAANGGALTGWSDHFVGRSHVVTVEVMFGSASATASAQWDPPPPPPPPSTVPPTSDVPTSDVPTSDVPSVVVSSTIVSSTIIPP